MLISKIEFAYQENTMNLAIISNPKGGNNRRKSLEKVVAIAASSNITHVTATTPTEMLQALCQLEKQDPEVLVINGGDGSVDMVISLMRNQEIFKKEPILALLKGGTTNFIHRDVGLDGVPHKALQNLISAQKRIELRCPLEIQTTSHKIKQMFGFLLGTGAIPRVILETRKTMHRKGLTGPLSEALMLSKVLYRLKCKRNLDNDELLKSTPLVRNNHQTDHIFLALTSLKKTFPGIGFQAEEDQMGLIQMDSDRKLKNERADKTVLELNDPWVLDGELMPPGEIYVKTGKPARFLVT